MTISGEAVFFSGTGSAGTAFAGDSSLFAAVAGGAKAATHDHWVETEASGLTGTLGVGAADALGSEGRGVVAAGKGGGVTE